MPYRGKPSKGCQECRSRKTKCGQQTPECLQCVKAGRACSGYRDQLDLMFCNQTWDSAKAVHTKKDTTKKEPTKKSKARQALAQAQPEVPGSNPSQLDSALKEEPETSNSDQSSDVHKSISSTSSSLSLASSAVAIPERNLMPSAEDQAIYFFFSNDAYSGHTASSVSLRMSSAIYDRDLPDGPLKTVVLAVGLAGLSHIARNDRVRTVAFLRYGGAMAKVNELLMNPKKATDDVIMFAVLTLSVFETMTCCDPKTMSRSVKHIHGAAILLKLRGLKQIETDTGLFLYLQLRSRLMVSCLQHQISVPQCLLDWEPAVDAVLAEHQRPGNELAKISARLANLRAAIKRGEISDLEDIIEKGNAIDRMLQTWVATLPDSWREHPVQVPMGTAEVLGTIYLAYEDVATATVRNSARCVTMVVHDLFIDKLKDYLASGKPVDDLNFNITDQLDISINRLKAMGGELLASVPYFLYIPTHIPGGQPHNAYTSAANGLACLWPIYIIGSSQGAPEIVRLWCLSRLLHIGHTTGIQQAISLAAVLKSQTDILGMKQSFADKTVTDFESIKVPRVEDEEDAVLKLEEEVQAGDGLGEGGRNLDAMTRERERLGLSEGLRMPIVADSALVV